MKTRIFTLVAIAVTSFMSAQSGTVIKTGPKVTAPRKEVIKRDPATGKTYIGTPNSKPRSVVKSPTRRSYIKNDKVVYSKKPHTNNGKHKGHHKGHHKNHKRK